MSKTIDRLGVSFWERRLFRNTFTYRGTRREVSGWCVKIQWNGCRRTVRLESGNRELAAREALALYGELRRGGWEALDRVRVRGRPEARGEGADPRLAGVKPRKYVSDLNPGRTREFFAEIRHQGETEYFALGTEEENEARLRALELRAQVAAMGWEGVRWVHPREVTVAVFWQNNPMTCTYTTLLSVPALSGGGGLPSVKPRGWRVLVIEPDPSVRRALVHWLSLSPPVGLVVGFGAAAEERPGADWDIVLCNREQSPTAFRALAEEVGKDDGPVRVLTHGLFEDSDAIFASVSGVTRGYFLQRLPPAGLLDPLVTAFPDRPKRPLHEIERQVARYFQAVFEPAGNRSESPVAGLTARESDVLDLLQRGFVDKEIARELGISVWTVHSHLKRIFAKYGVRTRTEAVVRHLQK